MPIHGFVYISLAAELLPEGALGKLHALSERSNRQRDVTGVLGFTGHYFLQYIEGRESAVAGLMKTIRRDARHVKLIECQLPAVSRRRFDQWSMRYFDSHALDADVREVHEGGVLTVATAERLIGRMVQALPPGHTLHALDR